MNQVIEHPDFDEVSFFDSRKLIKGTNETNRFRSNDPLEFPQELLYKDPGGYNLIGDIVLAFKTEYDAPKQFLYFSAATCLGVLASPFCHFFLGADAYPTLFTLLIGESFRSRKSVSSRLVVELFEDTFPNPEPIPNCNMSRVIPIINGVGGDVGLAFAINAQPYKNVMLYLDELQTTSQKAKYRGSALMSSLASVSTSGRIGNSAKDGMYNARGGRLGVLACCTTDLLDGMFTNKDEQIGFINRILIIHGESDGSVLGEPFELPKPLYKELQDKLLDTERWITSNVETNGKNTNSGNKKLIFDFKNDAAHSLFNNFVAEVQLELNKEHGKLYDRIETLFKKLLCLFCINEQKLQADEGIVHKAILAVRYEIEMRKEYTPATYASKDDKIEQAILTVLANNANSSFTSAKIHSMGKLGKKGITVEDIAKKAEVLAKAGRIVQEFSERGTAYYRISNQSV